MKLYFRNCFAPFSKKRDTFTKTREGMRKIRLTNRTSVIFRDFGFGGKFKLKNTFFHEFSLSLYLHLVQV